MKKKQIVVLGLGRFGTSVARTLFEMGHDVLAVDSNPAHVDAAAPFVTQAIQANVTDEEALATLGIRNFDVAVVSIGQNVSDSILVSLLCKEAGIGHVIAKATDELHGKVLKKVGVDEIIFPERDMGVRVAKSLIMPNVLELMALSDTHQLAEIMLPIKWVGHTVGELNIRKRYGVMVLAVNRGNDFKVSPNADFMLEDQDKLLVLGNQQDIQKIEND